MSPQAADTDWDDLKRWIGKIETLADQVTTTPLRALAATLDRDDPAPQPGDAVPPCWHWLYFLPLHRQSEIGQDGHARRGRFLPPVPLPRRMWAGSRLEFVRPLRVGESITRTSRIVDVSAKEGRTGGLVFVRVRHEITGATGLGVIEEQDLVYREFSNSRQTAALAPLTHHWARDIRADDVLLFRYSALTFNGHRIHYNRPYAQEVEGYPGLVVHGPLLATLLLDLLRRQLPDAQISRFSFRAVKPIFDVSPFRLCGRCSDDRKTIHLWAQHEDGALAMDATATLLTELPLHLTDTKLLS
jgi:3-methylfumaryl-CoA hydratase